MITSEQLIEVNGQLESLKRQICRAYEIAHLRSTGPAVPDHLWEIREILVSIPNELDDLMGILEP